MQGWPCGEELQGAISIKSTKAQLLLSLPWPSTWRKPRSWGLGMARTPKDSTLLAAVGIVAHLTVSRGQPWSSHFCVVSLGASLEVWGLQGPLAEGAAHSCGLPVLGKQRAWDKDPFLWCPRPGKELVGFPAA